MNVEALVLRSASIVAPQVDKAMLALLLICGSTLVLIFGLMVFFGIRYRKNSNHSRKLSKRGHLILEWVWVFGSLVIFLGLFVWGAVVYFEMHVAPVGAAEVAVVGKQWMWKFQHPNGRKEINELHVPVGQPVLLTMISQDVIHSLFVPDFRLKQDVLPGRYTRTWFEASQIGEYRLYCTQYCGTMHAQMIGHLFVLSEDDYKKWLEEDVTSDTKLTAETMASRGGTLFAKLGCTSCHSETSKNLGPPLQGVFGSKVKLSTGTTILADENYIRESILYPDVKIVHGYEAIMPTYLGRINEEEILELIAYIKSLSAKNAPKALGTTPSSFEPNSGGP